MCGAILPTCTLMLSKEDFSILDQCWAESLAPTGNFPASYEPNRNVKISAGHVPISDNVNRKC